MHYVYIIYTLRGNKYYKGYSQDPVKRLNQYNNEESRYTSKYSDWELIYIESFDAKTNALKREKVLKKYSHDQINSLVNSPKNQLNDYLP